MEEDNRSNDPRFRWNTKIADKDLGEIFTGVQAFALMAADRADDNLRNDCHTLIKQVGAAYEVEFGMEDVAAAASAYLMASALKSVEALAHATVIRNKGEPQHVALGKVAFIVDLMFRELTRVANVGLEAGSANVGFDKAVRIVHQTQEPTMDNVQKAAEAAADLLKRAQYKSKLN